MFVVFENVPADPDRIMAGILTRTGSNTPSEPARLSIEERQAKARALESRLAAST